MSRHYRWLSIVIASVLVSGACSLDPQKAKQKYLQSGIRYMEKHRYQEAIIQFQNALKLDPKYADAFFQMAQAHSASQDWQNTYLELTEAIRLDPGRSDAHLSLGNLYLSGKKYAEAEEQAKIVLKKDSNNADAHQLLAMSLAARGQHEQALEAFLKVVALRPQDAKSYLNLALAELSLQRRADAEKHLQQAIQVNPHTPAAYINLANLYRLQRDVPRGAQVLQQGVEKNTDDNGLYLTWAEFLYAGQNKQEADGALKKLRDTRPKSAPVALSIADFYAARGETDKAIAEYRRGIQLDPKNIEIKDHLVERYIESGRLKEADTLNNEILKQRPKNVYAGIASGRILLAGGKTQEAVMQFQNVITQAQDSPEAHYYLAIAYRKNQKVPQAKSEIQEALRLSPEMSVAQRALVEIHLSLGEIQEAKKLAEQLTLRNPESVVDKVLMANVLMRERAPDKARAQLLAARELAPNDPAIALSVAQTYAAEHKSTEAEKELETILKQNPRFTPALEQLANIAVALNQRDKGIERVSRYVAQYPDDASGHMILGRLNAGAKQYGPAKDEFQKAFELNPKLTAACLQLGNVYQQQRDPAPAVQTFEKCLALEPNLALAHGILGHLYEQQKNEDMARKHYEQALALNPNYFGVANNLAWLYAKEGKNLDVALGLAQKAKQLEPDSPITTDTLAWVQYKKGLYSGAVPLLQDCVAKAPKTPVYHYHLGMALVANGDKKRGDQELQTALGLNLAGEDAEQAKATLKER